MKKLQPNIKMIKTKQKNKEISKSQINNIN